MAAIEETEQAHRNRVIGAVVTTVADDHLRRRQPIEHPLHGLAIEGEIRVHQHDHVGADERNGRPNGSAFPSMPPHAVHADVGVTGGVALCLVKRVVYAAVVDHEDLDAGAEPRFQRRQRRCDPDSLVETGKNDRNARRGAHLLTESPRRLHTTERPHAQPPVPRGRSPRCRSFWRRLRRRARTD